MNPVLNPGVKLGLVGHPVGHSLSPLIHNHWLGRHGLRGRYEAFDIPPGGPPGELESAIARLVAGGLSGFNVTIPHKRAVMDLCAELDESARAAGAVNTVCAGPGGALRGMNTDAAGFAQSLEEGAPGFGFEAASALVLGTGGAAGAVVRGLRSLGVRAVAVAGRGAEKTQSLAAGFAAQPVAWEDRHRAAEACAVLVNATPTGMTGYAEGDLPLDPAVLPPEALVCDIVYRPLRTRLLEAAARRGLRTVTGDGMLLHQARLSFAAWTGTLPEIDEGLRKKIREEAR